LTAFRPTSADLRFEPLRCRSSHASWSRYGKFRGDTFKVDLLLRAPDSVAATQPRNPALQPRWRSRTRPPPRERAAADAAPTRPRRSARLPAGLQSHRGFSEIGRPLVYAGSLAIARQRQPARPVPPARWLDERPQPRPCRTDIGDLRRAAPEERCPALRGW